MANGNSYAVRLEDVLVSFGNRIVLNHISFEVRSGTAFCILGRSGTGKSVTLKQIVGLLKPDSGRIYVEDDEITHMDSTELARVRKKMGFLFQGAALFDSITVGENVCFPLRRHTKLTSAEIERVAREKLALVGLEKEWTKMPADLSGGMKKRAGLARAMAMNPSILLVDEPSSGLDPITSAEIDDLLLQMKNQQQVTIILVTHNIPSARKIADEMVMLHEGQIIERGSVDEMDKSQNHIVQAFMHSREGG